MPIQLRLLAMVVFFTGAVACNKTTSTPTPSSSGTSQTQGAPTYPHGADFYKNHGTTYLSNKTQCLACHGADGSGGQANVSCVSCHSTFPHSTDWVMPTKHSVAFVNNPQSCSMCHGQDYQGGKSNVSCSQCHQGFPHPLGWAAPSKHGKAFEAVKNKADCLTCHDPANASALATRCDSCHSAYPHTDNFENGADNHPKLAATYEGKCTACHHNFVDNMPNDGAYGGCVMCHTPDVLQIKWVPTPPPPNSPSSAPAPCANPAPATPSAHAQKTTAKNAKAQGRKPSSKHKAVPVKKSNTTPSAAKPAPTSP